MKYSKSLIAAAVLVAAGTAASADVPTGPSFFAGFVWTMGAGPGLSLKYTTSNEPNIPALTGGVSYYFDNGWGADVGISYSTCTLTGTVGYDFLQNGIQFGVGALSDPYCFIF